MDNTLVSIKKASTMEKRNMTQYCGSFRVEFFLMRIMRRKGRREAFTLSRNSYVLLSNPKTIGDFR